jgi:hypothetical protein
MNFVKSVFDLANSFMRYPKHIEISQDHYLSMVEKIQNTPVPSWPKREIKNPELEVLSTLIKNSINYCYWYGRYDIRPNDSCASKLGKIVDKHMDPQKPFANVLGNIKREIILERFPLISERIKHLEEISFHGMEFSIKVCDNHDKPVERLMKGLFQYFPGYSADMFLKRASLFFVELYRIFGWFKEDMKNIFVPADYQLPKLLEHYGVLKYSYDLKNKILSHQLIPKNSLEECEIRAATIIVCDRLSKATGRNIADIDSWLWLNRDSIDTPFHLTITTDY